MEQSLRHMICPECNSNIIEIKEQREGGYFETVIYCNGCGNTEVEK